jgi:3-isopropylmalate/(R)-2-methylmalate dehydratase large subunit
MTIIEKILASHSGKKRVKPGEIVDVFIDVRLARDFGGAGVLQNLQSNHLQIADPRRTFFTFDCNPTGSDQLYASNQHRCRLFARENNITVYDINAGIGTHLAIDEGLAIPGSTLVSTDSHANILGAIGAFGQGMGDRDMAAVWSRGLVWFKVPETVKVVFKGERNKYTTAKDIVLGMLRKFGADSLLGYAVEIYGEEADILTLDERITISSMATEMGAIALIFPPSNEVLEYCKSRSYQQINPVYADPDARYVREVDMDIHLDDAQIALPGHPHHVVSVHEVKGLKIDSAFVGSCTNGRIEDMQEAARLLKGRKIAPGVMCKIVPSTDEVWNHCLSKGYLELFKSAGALVGNAGCAGCASGQIGQNGPGEITVSTGNRNFEGKQGKGAVYLASVSTAIASAIAGHITPANAIPDHPTLFGTSVINPKTEMLTPQPQMLKVKHQPVNLMLTGRIWLINSDHIDTDMIYHNRHLAIVNPEEMGRFAFGNLQGFENFAQQSQQGDMIITGVNFGAGSSRQHAVDCFKSLGIQAILARSFGSIYERNAINAGFPVLTYTDIGKLDLVNMDIVEVDLEKGSIMNKRNGKKAVISKFSAVQKMIYEKGDLLSLT